MSTDRPLSEPEQSAEADIGAQMISLLTQQCALYKRLAVLADTQHSLITGNRPEQLLTVLADRQTLLDELHQLAERMRPYQERWPNLRATLHRGKVDAIDRLLKEVNQLLRGILEKDKADAQLLAAQKQTTGAAIASCKAGRKAETAYATQAYGQQACRDWTDQ